MTELGNKHECLGCGTKFYDLGKNELICPQCGENQKDLANAADGPAGKDSQRGKKKKKTAKKKAAKKKAAPKKKAKKEEKETKDAKEKA